MATHDLIKLFDGTKIRVVWDDKQEKYYFSVVDVVSVLTENGDYQLARNYWKVLKHRLIKEGAECNEPQKLNKKLLEFYYETFL